MTIRLPKEARKLQQINYNANVAKRNAQQVELSDTKVLNIISDLRAAPSDDYLSKICLIGLCVGSRISEIILVSTYGEAENPKYIEVTGVSKDRRRNEEKEEDNERSFVKPIIMLQSEEVIDTVIDLRRRLEAKYGWDLGEAEGGIQVDAKKVTSVVDAGANKRIRELFGESYVFHDTRAIYAQLAYVQYGPPGMSQTYFYSQVLGHKENSLATSLSYQTFAIRRKLKEDDPDLVSKITNLEVQFDHLMKEQRSTAPPPEEREKMVRITNKQGISIVLKKQRLIRESQAARMARLRAAVEEMEEAGITPTYRSVASLGFGGRVVNAYFREEKQRKEDQQRAEEKQEEKNLV